MTPTEVRALLERFGLAPSRERGQNFLVDAAVADALAEASGAGPGDSVIEIGAGLGILSRALAARGAAVLALEIDAGLVRALRAEALLPDAVELRHADALAQDWPALVRERGAGFVLGNLPYSISSPLLRRLLDLRGELRAWSVMIQSDVAERLLAGPGSRSYGSLSVLHQLCVRVHKVRELPGELFFPRPRVRSTFLRMEPRADAAVLPGGLEAVERVVRAAFGQRRKTLANALAGAGVEGPGGEPAAALCARAGVDPRARAEALAPEAFADLAAARAAAP